MKKYVSVLLAVLIVFGTGCFSCIAENEYIFCINTVAEKGKTKAIDFDETYKRNIAVEIDYDLSEKSWSGNCNIPFIVMNGTAELGRMTIMSEDTKLLGTKILNGSTYRDTCAVERKGTARIEVDYENRIFVYKWLGSGIKSEAVLGYEKFTLSGDGGITGIKIGASGNPGTDINVRVYENEICERKSNYTFNSAYGFKLNGLSEFSRGTDGITTETEPKDDTNGILKIPAGEKLDMVFMPIDLGFSGRVSLKYRIFAAADKECIPSFGEIKEYITGSTKNVVSAKLSTLNKIAVTGEKTGYTANCEKYINRWVNFEYLFDLSNNTVGVYVDGSRVYVGENDTDIKIADSSLINRFYIYNTDCDVYMDDLSITEIYLPELSSDMFKINEEKGIISGIAQHAASSVLLSGLNVKNGSAKIISADGTEKNGLLCEGDRLVLRDRSGIYEKQYTIAAYSEDMPQGNPNDMPIYHTESQTIGKGQNKTFAIGTYNENIALEADYTLEGASWDGDCNIPFILLDKNGDEVGRISIYSADLPILSTRMENGSSIIKTGGIDRKGTIRIETDFTKKRLIFKYLGNEYKKSASLGYIPFKNTDISDIGGLKIGASANPGVTVDIRVYNENPKAKRTEYNFENTYSEDLRTYGDFEACDNSVTIANDPKNKDNKCLYIPCGTNMNMNFMPRDLGFSDNVRVKYRLYMSEEIIGAEISAIQEYITGSTKSIVTLKAVSNTELEFSGENSKSTVVCEPFAGRWIELEYFLNLSEKKASVTADGKTVSDFNITDAALINRIRAKSTVSDIYFDDVEISDGKKINIFSDTYTIDNENRIILGVDISDNANQIVENINSYENTVLFTDKNGKEKIGRAQIGDMLKVTDEIGGYSVYYTLEYRNAVTDFENGANVSYKGGTICKAPYGKSGYALRSDGASKTTVYLPADRVYNTVELSLCFENNTARRTITIDNASGGSFSKMYLQNQESTAFLAGDGALNHIVTTEDKTWHRYKAVIDKTANKASWFIDGRPLQTEPIDFANLYNGENTLTSVSIENSEGAFTYIDDVTVSLTESVGFSAESTAYTVDNEYNMITDIPYNVTVEDVTSKISPKGYVVAADGTIKSEKAYIIQGDAIRFETNGRKIEYALGLNVSESDNTASGNTYEIYVSDSANGTGTKDSPFGTLEEAFASAEKINGNVNIKILGNTFGKRAYIKNINKENGNITLEAEAAIIGGNVLSFRKLNETEKETFSSAPDEILCADISGLFIGKTVQSGWNLPFVPSSAQLIVNGKTENSARYPNEGYITSGDIISSSSSKLVFEYADERAETWQSFENARIWSHFDVTYGGYDTEISDVDTENKTVTLSGNMYSSNVSKPIEYYYFNIPEELDMPGEYYIDEERKLLYYYPETDISRAVLTDGTNALLRFENCNNITINGITFEGGRGNGIEISECNNVTVKNCKISGSGMNGITVTGGIGCGIENSEIAYTDGDAVKISGGDIYTLTRANHYVKNCRIHDFSLRKKSYTSAVTTAGCGHKIIGNNIYNAPHTGLFIRSCNTEIAENSFKNLTYDAQDMGCIYSVDTYTRRGISIHDNYFENIRNKYSDKTGLVKCIYMDNFTSGWEIYNNVFRNCDQGIHANGGRENTVRDNLFISVDLPLGMYNLSNATFISPLLYQANFAPVSSVLWKTNYRGIDEITEIYPGYPNNTSAYGNVIADAKTNSLAYDAYMSLSDSATVSADKVQDGKIYDYDFCVKYVKNIADKVNTERMEIDGLVPFCGELHMTTGETKDVYVKNGTEKFEPQVISSSNETVIRTDGKAITAVNCGVADITVKYGDFTDVIRIAVKSQTP